VSQDHEYVQHPNVNRRHREEVDRYHTLDGFPRKVRQVCDGGLRSRSIYLPTLVSPMFGAELEQFSMDARCSPKRVVADHLANQFASLDRYAGATATTKNRFPSPKPAEALSVPTDDRLRLDHDQGRTPTPPSGCQTCPEEPIRSGQLRSLHRAFENVEVGSFERSPHSAGTHGRESNPGSRPKWPISLKLA